MEAFRFAGPAVVHHEVLNVTALCAVTSRFLFNGFGCGFRTVELPQRKVRHNERCADIRGEQLILWKWIGVCRPGGRVEPPRAWRMASGQEEGHGRTRAD